jgi:hypothetical protein
MSVTTAREDDSAGSIRVARTVLHELHDLFDDDPDAASAVRQAIDSVGRIAGEPFRADIPGYPPGREYFAIAPTDEAAPVVVFRRDDDGWLVAALISREAYSRQKMAEQRAVISSGVAAGAVIGSAVAFGDVINRAMGRGSG